MRKLRGVYGLMLFFFAFTVSSCSAVEGIFKAGMSVGVFAVILVIAIIVFIIIKIGRNKS